MTLFFFFLGVEATNPNNGQFVKLVTFQMLFDQIVDGSFYLCVLLSKSCISRSWCIKVDGGDEDYAARILGEYIRENLAAGYTAPYT